ncbi:MAG: hypothetical protein ACLPKI_32145 [Streptosporangiaceae bacterium]
MVEVFLADHELTLGVHEVNSAIGGNLAADVRSSVTRGLVAPEPSNDVVNLVVNLGF